jgi:SAM-dependent methyltransferase
MSDTKPVRDRCNICGRARDDLHEPLVRQPCHVRAFLGEFFHLWRCSGCRTIHGLERVDLDHYYAQYPFAKMELNGFVRKAYGNQLARLTAHGLSREHRLLDYGCAKGLFVDYLREAGYGNAHGYDPYGDPTTLGDRSVLERGPFDAVVLQDVLEHVESPEELFATLDRLVAPGGLVLVGTPNADQLDLARGTYFINELHAPYHLHIYTRETTEKLAAKFGWQPAGFFDRSYFEVRSFGMNGRAGKVYQRLLDGTMDAALEPPRVLRALCSPTFVFYALFGYWLSDHSDMTVIFRKSPNQ